jgi:hypothetical protein
LAQVESAIVNVRWPEAHNILPPLARVEIEQKPLADVAREFFLGGG